MDLGQSYFNVQPVKTDSGFRDVFEIRVKDFLGTLKNFCENSDSHFEFRNLT